MPENPVSLIPKPYRLTAAGSPFTLDASTAIVATDQAKEVGRYLQSTLAPATGLPLPVVSNHRNDGIYLLLDPDLHDVGCEGYTLKVAKDGIEIRAPRPAGLFYGAQTLRQLLPPNVFRRAKVKDAVWTIPGVDIVDHPRFPWRGAHLDVSRHFMPKAFIFKWIDLMVLHKLNIFHWHLVDSHGWRIEIKKYPELAIKGSKTDFSEIHPRERTRSVSRQAGGYYTQDDIREIVAYAAERFVIVVPEIEMPGHSHAALEVYPQYGNAVQIRAAGGDTSFMGDPAWEDVYNVDDSTIRFLQDILDEVMDLFPSSFIHIGGDEVPKEPWKKNPRAQARMKEQGLKDEEELQSWFIGQMDAYLQSKGRRLLGWDEILEGGLAAGATVMSWRGEEGGIAAAQAGHDVVMSPGSHTYFDHYQTRLRHREPLGIGGFTTVQKAYSYEPIPKELTTGQAIHVLGAQFQLWSEWLPHPSHVEYMTWPRGCALAEAFWSPAEGRSYEEFEPRLIRHLNRLNVLDVNYRRLHPEPDPIGQWKVGGTKREATLEWDVPDGPSGRYTAAFTTTHRDKPFKVSKASVVAGGKTLADIGQIDLTDRNCRGCEKAVQLPALSGAKLKATIALECDGELDGDAFLFPEPAG